MKDLSPILIGCLIVALIIFLFPRNRDCNSEYFNKKDECAILLKKGKIQDYRNCKIELDSIKNK